MQHKFIGIGSYWSCWRTWAKRLPWIKWYTGTTWRNGIQMTSIFTMFSNTCVHYKGIQGEVGLNGSKGQKGEPGEQGPQGINVSF